MFGLIAGTVRSIGTGRQGDASAGKPHRAEPETVKSLEAETQPSYCDALTGIRFASIGAGLVLFWPHLERLFALLLNDQQQWLSPEHQWQALKGMSPHSLQQLFVQRTGGISTRPPMAGV